jgi:hypothetical protein
MRSLKVPLAALLCLAAAPALVRAADDNKPQFVVAVKSVDGLLADGAYLAKLANKENEFKQYSSFVTGLADPKKGINGLDTKRSAGVYGWINTDNPQNSEIVALAPVMDQDALLDWVGTLGVKPEKGTDGVYKVQFPGGSEPVFYTFANKYVYATYHDKAPLAKGRLMDPKDVLPPEGTSLVSAVFHVDRLPDKSRDAAVKNLTDAMDKAKDQAQPGETPAAKAFRLGAIDEFTDIAKSVITDGADLSLSVDVDRKAGEVSVAGSFAGKPGSKLAAAIADLGRKDSVGAGVAALGGPDAVGTSVVNLKLPPKVQKPLNELIDEGEKKALEDAKDKAGKDLAATLFEALNPTLKAGELDMGSFTRAPGAKGYYTIGLGLRVTEGLKAEKTLKKALADLPKDAQDKVGEKLKVDFAKQGDVNIHRVMLEEKDFGEQGAEVLKVIGPNPIFFAFRDDALVMGMGEDGLKAVKDALEAKLKPGAVVESESGLAKLDKAYPQVKGWADAAKKAFKAPGDDKVSFRVEGGKALTIRVAAKAAIVTFGAELADANSKK